VSAARPTVDQGRTRLERLEQARIRREEGKLALSVGKTQIQVVPDVSRCALVTGAAAGIGRAIAERLEADGWVVHAVDVEDGDLGTRDGNRAVVDAALERFGGRLDAVVANAGFQHVAPVREFPEDRWDALQAVLLTSPFLLAKYTWDALAASGDGRFLVVASVHGLVASPFKAGYVAAKHGTIGLVKVLALEGAEVGISASALCPAYVRTELVERQLDERSLDDLLAPQAVKRLLEPEEVAAAAAWLLGPNGRAVTGTPFVLDLGWTAR
jgi:3-hydroxybutyrate dehydrogenase